MIKTFVNVLLIILAVFVVLGLLYVFGFIIFDAFITIRFKFSKNEKYIKWYYKFKEE
jgi:hypothetical protein